MKYINVEFKNGYVFKMEIHWGWYEKELAYWKSPDRKNVVKVWVE